MLNTCSTERRKQLLWDPQSLDESTEMIASVQSLIDKGYTGYVDRLGGIAVLAPPPLGASKLVLRVLCDSGDKRLVWDRCSLAQIEEARRVFDKYISLGYKAYAVRMCDAATGAEVETFDELYQELVMKPGKEALMVPPVIPG